MHIWDKIFKNGPSEICERQHLKNFKWPRQFQFKFLKGSFFKIFHKFYLNILTEIYAKSKYLSEMKLY